VKTARGMETGSVLTVLEASCRRRSLAAETFRATLAGLAEVHVQVEPVNDDAERDGFRRADVQADVESTLRAGDIGIVTQTALFASVPGTPVLHVDVMTVGLDGRYAYSARLELWQAVRLVRRPAVTALALTWSAPQIVGTVAAENLTELRGAVRAAVTGFVEECRTATAGATG